MPTNKEIFDSKMDALANSINTKAGTSGAMDIDEMKTAVDSIQTGGITPTGTKSITANGTYDVTSYASAAVAIPIYDGTVTSA
jgi:hypothetical protein